MIFGFSPNSGTAETTVDIRGSYFKHVNITGILFGNNPTASFIVVSEFIIKAVVGNGATTPICLYINNFYGNQLQNSFYYCIPVPVIS